jgi:hypothetical protein
LKQSIAHALGRDNPARVPNYKFTETIARRLGKEYLRLLKAFRAQRTGNEWVVNHVHRWAAESLMDGSVACIVTTNFDDCIERALENAGANAYLLTGDPYIDGAAIVERMGPSSGRLILIVNGPRACDFAQNMLPQVGKLVSILFKLHGSCYAPETCIDTRLQRQQGLPSYTVNILDHLLVRTVFYILCFSGGDLNDNTDYLRMIHNKKHVRLVWLQPADAVLEPGVAALSEQLATDGDASEGLCVLHGLMRGEKVRWNDEVNAFKQCVVDWCREVGPTWCKLVVLGLMELCSATDSQRPMLERLGFTDSQRQDWNAVVERELGQPELETQVRDAKHKY